jgi:hypothetical protein
VERSPSVTISICDFVREYLFQHQATLGMLLTHASRASFISAIPDENWGQQRTAELLTVEQNNNFYCGVVSYCGQQVIAWALK